MMSARRVARLHFSEGFVEDIFTAGRVLKVQAGIPKGARVVGSERDPLRGTLTLYYEHPDIQVVVETDERMCVLGPSDAPNSQDLIARELKDARSRIAQLQDKIDEYMSVPLVHRVSQGRISCAAVRSIIEPLPVLSQMLETGMAKLRKDLMADTSNVVPIALQEGATVRFSVDLVGVP